MTRFNNHGPSGERYRRRIQTPSMRMMPYEGESEEDFEERRRNMKAIEIMESYNKLMTEKVARGENVEEPKVMTYQMAREMVDDSIKEVGEALAEARRRKPTGRISEVLEQVRLEREATRRQQKDSSET